MRDVLVRTAKPDDAVPIAEIHVALWQSAYRGLLPDSLLDDLRRVALWVLDGNTRAIAFYERQGWAAEGRTKVDERGGIARQKLAYTRRL